VLVAERGGRGSRPTSQWVSAWFAAQQGPCPYGFVEQPLPLEGVFPEWEARDQTVFLVVRPVVSGDGLIIRLSNRYGDRPVEFGAVTAGGAPVEFGGRRSCVVIAGAEILSDPIDRSVNAFEKLVVALHVRGCSGSMTWHAKALTTSWASAPGSGDLSAGAAAGVPLHSWFWLSEVVVRSAEPPNVLIAIGDSLTDGTTLGVDAYERWTDVFSQQFAPYFVALNAGIGSNRIGFRTNGKLIGELVGEPSEDPCRNCGAIALERLRSDVLDRDGVTACAVAGGLNDLVAGASALDVITGFGRLASELTAAGVEAIGCTIPGAGASDYGRDCVAAVAEVNTWLRSSASPFGRLADFAAAVADPGDPTALDCCCDGGDGIHPNALGHTRMAEAVAVALGLIRV